MTDHLPECIYAPEKFDPEQNIMWGGKPCICDALRACEQRVRQSAATLWDRTSEQMAATRVEGIRAGLDAAREAVAATFIGWCKDYMNCTDYEHVCGKRREIIAAIDALRLPAKP